MNTVKKNLKSLTEKIKNKDLFWEVDGNYWSKAAHTLEEAKKKAKIMINCVNCRNCDNCVDCVDCINCMDCKDCENSEGCYRCENCTGCISCNRQKDSEDCIYLHEWESPSLGWRNGGDE